MGTSPNTLVQALTLVALLLAVGSLLMAAFFVRDRRQRVPGLLLPIGIICSIIGRRFSDERMAIVFACFSIVLVVVSTFLSIRLLRTRSD